MGRPFDAVPGDGVVVSAVDQRPEACANDDETPAGCFGQVRRQSRRRTRRTAWTRFWAWATPSGSPGVRIAVTGRSGDRFAVRIDGARARFDPLLPTVCVLVPAVCGGLQGPLPG